MIDKVDLKEGDIIIFPTDTVFGIGCRLYDNKAVNRIFEIKERPVDKHIPVLCDSLSMIQEIGVVDSRVIKLARMFWPGPLTLILRSQRKHFKKTGNFTVGLRIPNNEVALNIINNNGPLYATSVNKSGQEPLTNIKDIKKHFENKVRYIYEQTNKIYTNISSTVVDLTTDEIRVLRKGSISKEDIIKTLKEE